MTVRFFCLLAALSTLYICALSTGAPVFYLFSILLLLILAYSLLSVLPAAFSSRVEQGLSRSKVMRGEKSSFTLVFSHSGILPVAPTILTLSMEGVSVSETLDTPPFRKARYEQEISTKHVGAAPAGVTEYVVRDLFELFKIRRQPAQSETLVVLPRSFHLEKLHFHELDEGRSLPNRTNEDITSPDGLRAYRPGDPMKRIHWKISQRKRSLYVRTYETPAPPDTLVLLDCSSPYKNAAYPDAEKMLRDALCETALSAAEMQSAEECPVRLPLYGERADEFQSGRSGSMVRLQEQLACQPFTGGEAFERVLALELRRMRRTGATVVITTQLTPSVVEGVARVRRMGPSVRFYYVTFTPEAPEDARLIAQLQHHMVEVCYVTPA